MRTPLALLIIFIFLLNTIGLVPARADELSLPMPGTMVHLSPFFNPPMLKGIKVHPENPFQFDFILDKGDQKVPAPFGAEADSTKVAGTLLQKEATKLIKYFLASLTIPEKDLWVNLSPYEKDRIVPESFGQTEMGRDLLAQDYLLKQITASLIYPEGDTGKAFWKRIYEESAKRFGTTNIPVNTFNKVWIVPEKAVVYENAKAGTAYVVESKLKVMLEEDYLAVEKNRGQPGDSSDRQNCHQAGCQASEALNAKAIIKEIVIPQLTKEINEGRNFAQLRQVYSSLILAAWYKKKIKDGILAQVYADKNKVAGVNINDPQEKQKIYERYLRAFKKGAYNYVKEEQDPVTQQAVPRKYFSGGVQLQFGEGVDGVMTTVNVLSGQDRDALDLKDNAMRVEVMIAPFQKALKRLLPVKLPKKWMELKGPTSVHAYQPTLFVEAMKRQGFSSAEIVRFFGGIDQLPTAAEQQKTVESVYGIVALRGQELKETLGQFEPKVREYVKEFLFFKAPSGGAEAFKNAYYVYMRGQAQHKYYQEFAVKTNMRPERAIEFLMEDFYKTYPNADLSKEILMMVNMGMALPEIKEYLLKDVPSLYGKDTQYAFAQLHRYILNTPPEKRPFDDKFLLFDFILYYPFQGESYEDSIAAAKKSEAIDRLTKNGFARELMEMTGVNADAAKRIIWLIAVTTPVLSLSKGYLTNLGQKAGDLLGLLKQGVFSDLKNFGLSQEQALRLALKISTNVRSGTRDGNEIGSDYKRTAELIHYASQMPEFKQLLGRMTYTPEIALRFIFTQFLLGDNSDRMGVQDVDLFVKVMSVLLEKGFTLAEVLHYANSRQWALAGYFTILDGALSDHGISDFIARSKNPKQATIFIMKTTRHDRNSGPGEEFISNTVALAKLFNQDQFASIGSILSQEKWSSEEFKLRAEFLNDLIKNKRIEFLRQQKVADEDIILFIKQRMEKPNFSQPYHIAYMWSFIDSIVRTGAIGALTDGKNTFAQVFHPMDLQSVANLSALQGGIDLFRMIFHIPNGRSDEKTAGVVIMSLEDMVKVSVNSNVRQKAIEQLSGSKRPETVEILAGVMNNSNEDQILRALAMQSLGRIASAGAALALVSVIKDPNEKDEICKDALEQLGKIISSKLGKLAVTEGDPNKDAILYWNDLVGLSEAVGQNPDYLFGWGLPAVGKFIKTRDGLEKYGKDLLDIIGRTKGAERQTLYSLFLLRFSLIDRFPSAWGNFIKPIIFRHTVGAFLVLKQISRLFETKAVQSQEDLDFLLKFTNKQGVKAADILKNFIVPGVGITKAMARPISKEGETLNAYFSQEGAYPIIEVYRAYKNAPDKYKELLGKCRVIHRALLDGDAKAYENDPLFPAMQMYVFPPEVTAERHMYATITSKRPDRPHDTDIIPDKLRKTGSLDISSGEYILKDASKPLDITPWSIILDVIEQENALTEHKMSDAETLAVAKDLLLRWQSGKLGEDKRELLGRLYRYYLAKGGALLPQDLNSVQNIMTLKEFSADTVRDVVSNVLKEYQDSNAVEYADVLNKMFKTKLENPKGAAAAVNGILGKFHDDPQEGRSRLGRLLKVNDAGVLDQLWDKLSELSSPQDIENVLAGLEFKVQPGKEADIIARQLLGEETSKMQGEFSAKYEFNEEGDKISLRFEVSKRRAHGVAGLNMGVCVVPDEKLWDDPNFMNVIIWNKDGIAQGGMHLLIIEDAGKKYLTLPGINPSTGLLTRVNADDIYNKLIAYALEISKTLGYAGVLIPTPAVIHSNRTEIQRVIISRSYKTETLTKEHQFSHSPHSYSFNAAFVVDSAMLTESARQVVKALRDPDILGGASLGVKTNFLMANIPSPWIQRKAVGNLVDHSRSPLYAASTIKALEELAGKGVPYALRGLEAVLHADTVVFPGVDKFSMVDEAKQRLDRNGVSGTIEDVIATATGLYSRRGASANRQRRQDAIRGLVQAGTPQAVEGLISVAREEMDYENREFNELALEGLAHIRTTQAVDGLITLARTDPFYYWSAIRKLEKIGTGQAVNGLISLIRDNGRDYKRHVVAGILDRIGTEIKYLHVESIRGGIKDMKDLVQDIKDVRSQARERSVAIIEGSMTALANIGTPEAVEGIIDFTKEQKDPYIRLLAVEELSRWAKFKEITLPLSLQATMVLADLIKHDPDGPVRIMAVITLAGLQESAESITGLAQDPHYLKRLNEFMAQVKDIHKKNYGSLDRPLRNYQLFSNFMLNEDVDFRLRMKVMDDYLEIVSLESAFNGKGLLAMLAKTRDGLNGMLMQIISANVSTAKKRKIWKGSGPLMKNLRADFLQYFLERKLSPNEAALLDNIEANKQMQVIISILSRLSFGETALMRRIAKESLNVLFLSYAGNLTDAKAKLNAFILGFEQNKKIMEGMVAKGYSPDLWTKGVEFEMNVSMGISEEKKREAIRQASFEMVEIALALGIKMIDGQPVSLDRAGGVDTYDKARSFFEHIKTSVPSIPEDTGNRLTDILGVIQRKEAEVVVKDQKAIRLRVTVQKDFLAEATAGLGVPGCFNPNGIHKEMPLMHGLEANTGFIQVYDAASGKQLANAVVAYGQEGAYVYPGYNASSYDMDDVFGRALAELTRYVPRLYLQSSSAGYRFLVQYKDKTAMEVKDGVDFMKFPAIFKQQYYDGGGVDKDGVLRIPGSLIVTKQSIQAKGGFKFLETEKTVEVGKNDAVNMPDIDFQRLADKFIANGRKKYLFIIKPLKQKLAIEGMQAVENGFHEWFYEKAKEKLKVVEKEESDGVAGLAVDFIKDTAMAASSKGGIDLNADKVDLEVKMDSRLRGNDNGIKFNIDPAMLEQMRNAPGFAPVIISVTPLTDLPLFLGLKAIDAPHA